MTIYDEFTRAYESYEGYEKSDLLGLARYLELRRGDGPSSGNKGTWHRVAEAFRKAGHGYSPGEALTNARTLLRRDEFAWV